jgi:hypothetical protein
MRFDARSYPSGPLQYNASRNPIKPGIKSGLKSGRALCQGSGTKVA